MTTYQKMEGKFRSAEFGDLESIAETVTRQHSEKIAILQMSEIATACNITQISTPRHVLLRNFRCILNTLIYIIGYISVYIIDVLPI